MTILRLLFSLCGFLQTMRHGMPPVHTAGFPLLLSAPAVLLSAPAVLLPQEAAAQRAAPGLPLADALILGFVEGATEYLPVSSTGHLLIVQHLLGHSGDHAQAQAADSLAICIQGGAILAVLLLYFDRIRQMLQGLAGRSEEGRRLLINLVVAFAPAAVLGLLLRDTIQHFLFGILPVAAALIAGGVLILLHPEPKQNAGNPGQIKPQGQNDLKDLRWTQALFIGLMQCVAMWPGFSRSLATILGCRWTGMKLGSAVEFSFLLGLVTLSAATAWETLKGGRIMLEQYGVLSPLLALAAAFFAAAISVRFMVTSLGRFGLRPFGYYRIALGIVCLLWLKA